MCDSGSVVLFAANRVSYTLLLCRGRTEGAEMYRTLGVTPDADYLEVMEACDRLKVKYAGDRKQVGGHDDDVVVVVVVVGGSRLPRGKFL